MVSNRRSARIQDVCGIRPPHAIIVSSLFSPLVFLGGFSVALGGMLLWGIGYATQGTLLKAVIAGVLPEGRRNLAFGLFYTGYGAGSVALPPAFSTRNPACF